MYPFTWKRSVAACAKTFITPALDPVTIDYPNLVKNSSEYNNVYTFRDGVRDLHSSLNIEWIRGKSKKVLETETDK